MNILLRLALIVTCFFAAIACFVFGVPFGGIAFVVLGIAFEGLLWLGIFGKKNAF